MKRFLICVAIFFILVFLLVPLLYGLLQKPDGDTMALPEAGTVGQQVVLAEGETGCQAETAFI